MKNSLILTLCLLLLSGCSSSGQYLVYLKGGSGGLPPEEGLSPDLQLVIDMGNDASYIGTTRSGPVIECDLDLLKSHPIVADVEPIGDNDCKALRKVDPTDRLVVFYKNLPKQLILPKGLKLKYIYSKGGFLALNVTGKVTGRLLKSLIKLKWVKYIEPSYPAWLD